MTTNRGLYIHIPFCAKKCGYCDFYSVALDTEIAQKYADELCRELTLVLSRYNDTVIDTVYIGGGTPSVLPQSIIARLIEHIYKCASVDIREFTIEVNPCSSDKLPLYKSLGIDRVSIGVQTLNPNILQRIGRLHTPVQAIGALEKAAEIFPNVSADLMLGLPSQTIGDVEDTLYKVMPYVNHISQYMLKLSDDTAMGRAVAEKSLLLPDDDSAADMYDKGFSIMQNNAFERYEISNFCKNNSYSLHNLKYWNREDYIGIGAAAHSFLRGVRYDNPCNLKAYLSGEHLGNGRANMIPIPHEDALFEYIMLKLRMDAGFAVDEINKIYNIDFFNLYEKEINSLKALLDLSDGRVRIKKDKMLLESYVAKKFLSY